jgi:hypothetical protein
LLRRFCAQRLVAGGTRVVRIGNDTAILPPALPRFQALQGHFATFLKGSHKRTWLISEEPEVREIGTWGKKEHVPSL